MATTSISGLSQTTTIDVATVFPVDYSGNTYKVTIATLSNFITNNATTVSASGTVTGGTLSAIGAVNASSHTGTIVSVTGTVTGGNFSTAGTVTATGNVTGGNFSTAGTVTATGTVTGGSLSTAGTVTGGSLSTAGTVTGGSLSTAGTVTATGTVTGGSLSTAGTVTGGSLSTAGTVTATGTVTGGNFSTAGTVTATGNVTGGNLNTAGTVTTGTLSVTGNNNIMPTGMIVMWYGSIASIPTGWYLCNGQVANGTQTPDLRDRFIVGAGSTYAVAATDGSADAVVVSHTHTFTGSALAAHTHQIGSRDSTANDGSNPLQEFVNDYGTGNGPPATTSSVSGGTPSGTISTTGSSGTNANLPPYYALAYIMKA